MPRIAYQKFRPSAGSLAIIDQANRILAEYQQRGIVVTLRQLYYQFVSRDIIPNKQSEYKRLGSIINDARLGGMIDWDFLQDRTRNLNSQSHWDSPAGVISSAAASYHRDLWEGQKNYVECFTPETPVLTKGTPLTIASVEVGDIVVTHTGKVRKVTKVIRNHYWGKMLRIKAAGLLPVEVTPKHPFWADSHDGACKAKGSGRRFTKTDWIKSEKLQKHDTVRVPLYVRRASVTGKSLIIGNESGRSKRITLKITSNALRVFGLYVAEGSVRADERTLQFTFNRNEVAHATLVKTWAASIGVSSSEALGAGTRIVYVYSKNLALWMENAFGDGAYNKRLPVWLMEANREEQILFAEYYFRGDGCLWDESRSAFTATSRSIALAQQIQIMLLRNRICAALNITQDHGKPRYQMTIGGLSVVEVGRLWGVPVPPKGLGRSARYNHIRFTESDAVFPIRSIEEFDYDGPVHNLEVEGDHSYCVPMAVHNCWVEKDALLSVIESICILWDVSFFACRGYTSQSEMWGAGQRIVGKVMNEDRHVKIIHLGDHDPSGVDMTRDIHERLEGFLAHHVWVDVVKKHIKNGGSRADERAITSVGVPIISSGIQINRIALNMDQIRQYEPPPNPAKLTDSRATAYINEHGDESWELDALDPDVLTNLIENAIREYVDEDLWNQTRDRQEKEREILTATSKNWEKVRKYVEKIA